MIQFLLGILLAILSFHINHRLKKIIDIKILINSLFELYGNEASFFEYNQKDVNLQLMQEIVSIEKMYDDNRFIKKEINKLIELRLLYFKYSTSYDTKSLELSIKGKLASIGFKKLGRSFIILSFLNIKT